MIQSPTTNEKSIEEFFRSKVIQIPMWNDGLFGRWGKRIKFDRWLLDGGIETETRAPLPLFSVITFNEIIGDEILSEVRNATKKTSK